MILKNFIYYLKYDIPETNEPNITKWRGKRNLIGLKMRNILLDFIPFKVLGVNFTPACGLIYKSGKYEQFFLNDD